MAGPTVSVVVIFLNGERFLRAAIEGVTRQSFTDWELLLVDDGSTDGSGAIAREFAAAEPARVRYLQHPGGINRGMSASRNLGVEQARGEWIALLDADDEWRPDHLAGLLAEAAQDEDAEVIYGPALTWYSWDPAAATPDLVQDVAAGDLARATDRRAVLATYLRQNGAIPCPSALFVRRATYLRLGGFEEAFRGMCEDQVFAVKVALGAKVHASPRVTLLYRRHDASCCAVSFTTGSDVRARIEFLRWARRYVAAQVPGDRDLDALLRDQLWHARRSTGFLGVANRAVHACLPDAARRWLRRRRAHQVSASR